MEVPEKKLNLQNNATISCSAMLSIATSEKRMKGWKRVIFVSSLAVSLLLSGTSYSGKTSHVLDRFAHEAVEKTTPTIAQGVNARSSELWHDRHQHFIQRLSELGNIQSLAKLQLAPEALLHGLRESSLSESPIHRFASAAMLEIVMHKVKPQLEKGKRLGLSQASKKCLTKLVDCRRERSEAELG